MRSIARLKFNEVKVISNAILASETDLTADARHVALALLTTIAVDEDDPERARQYVERLLEVRPGTNLDWTRNGLRFMKDQDWVDHLVETQKEAGMPEPPTE